MTISRTLASIKIPPATVNDCPSATMIGSKLKSTRLICRREKRLPRTRSRSETILFTLALSHRGTRVINIEHSRCWRSDESVASFRSWHVDIFDSRSRCTFLLECEKSTCGALHDDSLPRDLDTKARERERKTRLSLLNSSLRDLHRVFSRIIWHAIPRASAKDNERARNRWRSNVLRVHVIVRKYRDFRFTVERWKNWDSNKNLSELGINVTSISFQFNVQSQIFPSISEADFNSISIEPQLYSSSISENIRSLPAKHHQRVSSTLWSEEYISRMSALCSCYRRTDVSRAQLPFETRTHGQFRSQRGIPVTFPPTHRPQAEEWRREKPFWHAREPF